MFLFSIFIYLQQIMIIVISPAKIQRIRELVTSLHSQAEYQKEASRLIKMLRELSYPEISRLLEINNKLTQINLDRYLQWHQPFTLENARQTILLFDGEVFRGLNAASFSEEEFLYAQNHLRIFSGLYGILKPLDLIQPYRLEVSSKLKNPAGDDLYPFWQKKVTKSIVRDLKASGEPEIILNLASSEYIKSIDLKNKRIRKIDVEFYEYNQDKLKQIVIYTKKARGMMARYIITHKIENTEDIKGFNEEGYWFNEQFSSENKFVFVR